MYISSSILLNMKNESYHKIVWLSILSRRILKDSVYILHNPLWLVWIFRTPILGNTSWWLLLYVLEVLVFQNTSKWMLSSLSNRVIFFLGIFLFKESPKKTRTFILTSMMRRNSVIAFHHVFMITFYAVTLQALFFTDKT